MRRIRRAAAALCAMACALVLTACPDQSSGKSGDADSAEDPSQPTESNE